MTTSLRAAAAVVAFPLLVPGAALAQTTQPAPTTAPSPTPATQTAVTQPVVEAPLDPTQAFLQEVGRAYDGLSTLELVAVVRGTYDVAGETLDEELAYTSAFAAPAKFRHEIPGELLMVSDGQTVSLFVPPVNRYYEFSLAGDAAVPVAAIPAVAGVLADHNPSLLFALADDATEAVQSLGQITAFEPAAGERGDLLRLVRPDKSVLELIFDPETHLLAAMSVEEKPALLAEGAQGVRTAVKWVSYGTVNTSADQPADLFTWEPPAAAVRATPGASAPALAEEAAPESQE